MTPQINGVAIPGFWLSKEYVAEKQVLSRRTPEPKFKHCERCGDPYGKTHHCVFAQAGEPA